MARLTNSPISNVNKYVTVLVSNPQLLGNEYYLADALA